MTDHTPGPWHVSGCYDGHATVAIVRSSDMQVTVNALDVAEPCGWAATDANAALLAAAPELRDALETYLSAEPQCSCTDVRGCEVAAARAKARAALHKADGRQP